MTDVARSRRARAGGAAARMSWLAGLCAFAALAALLGWRMASGHDPALGARRTAPAVAAAPPPRRVIVRRIERKVIITRVLPPRPQPVAAAPVATAGYVAPQAAAYTPPPSAAYVAPQRSAPVAPARPAYVPPPPRVVVAAPVPAPAPAPHVVTRAS